MRGVRKTLLDKNNGKSSSFLIFKNIANFEEFFVFPLQKSLENHIQVQNLYNNWKWCFERIFGSMETKN